MGINILLILILLTGSRLAYPKEVKISSSLDVPVTHEAKAGDLVDVLTFVAARFHVPIIAELSQPIPQKINVPPGTHRAREVLDLIFKNTPGYSWKAVRNVAHVYNKLLLEAPKNFLNAKLQTFRVPPNVEELQRSLRAVLPDINGITYEGIATTGLADHNLTTINLPTKTLHNVTGREVLLQAAEANASFYSLVVFPHARPRTQADLDSAYSNWFWRALDTEEAEKIYVQKPASQQ